MKQNPLLENTELPQFSKIRPEHVEPAVAQVLEENRARIAALTTSSPIDKWDDLIPPLENLDNRLSQVWSPVSHLHSVLSSDELRKAYKLCIPQLTDYQTELEQNQQLYQAFSQLEKSPEFSKLTSVQQKVIKDQLRDFHLSGVSLPADKKKRYAEIQTRLAQLTTQFEEHLLDATQGWTKHIEDLEQLKGIPPHVLQTAQETAHKKGLKGWLLTLEFPCYFPIISYAENRKLREEMYTAYTTRASDQGPQAGQFDNSATMAEILALRHELSLLLDFPNYAELSLATKMVKQPQRVLDFLSDLVAKAKPKALEELAELKKFAQECDGINEELKPWDVSYYSEKLRDKKFGITDEMLRPYFPEPQVLQGMFKLIELLYNVRVVEQKHMDTWHPDVRFFTIYDADDNLRGQFYLDLYSRPQKRGGAWMDGCRARWRKLDSSIQSPIVFLTCNLTPPVGNQPALLTHDEVLTIFHEFGHGLHHMLTQVDYLSVSGIHGVEWDAVELPSQFMEFFVWEKSVLNFTSQHYQTGKTLPDDLLQRLLAVKNFNSGIKLLRQLEFALFDFRLHLTYQPEQAKDFIQHTLDKVRKEVSVIPVPSWNRFQHSFSHVFAGGYAAGYYSYLWAEMLACDVFAKFEEEGVLNPKVGHEFLSIILENGGSFEALELFKRFRGREPDSAALLRHFGV